MATFASGAPSAAAPAARRFDRAAARRSRRRHAADAAGRDRQGGERAHLGRGGHAGDPGGRVMTRFRYRAVNPAGDLIEGEVDGQDQTAVVAQLRRQGHLLLATEPVIAGAEDVGSTVQRWLSQPLFGRRRVGRREVALITRQLATMLDAGLTIDQTLRFLVDLADSEALRRLLTDLLARVQGGSTLADACAEHEAVFTRAYVSLVRAGEAGGALNEVLARLADYLENAERLAEQVKSALVYPIILLVMAGLSIVVLLAVVVPQFTPLFESAGAELPALTRNRAR